MPNDCIFVATNRWINIPTAIPSKPARNPRIICAVLLTFCYVYTITMPLANYCSITGSDCTIWLLPHITATPSCILILMSLFVIFVCDSPNLFTYQIYVISRSGKIRWIIGQLLYVAGSSAVFWITVVFSYVICLQPNISTSLGWGKMLRTIAFYPSVLNGKNQFEIFLPIVNELSGIQAFALAFGLANLVSCFIGVIITAFNISFNKSFGVIAALLLIAFQHFTYLTSGYWAYNVSPISWVSLRVVNYSDRVNHMPSLDSVTIYLVIMIFILSIYIVLRIKNNAMVFLEKE